MDTKKTGALRGPTILFKSGRAKSGINILSELGEKERVDFTGGKLRRSRRRLPVQHVIVLGGGVAGLTAAYELLKLNKPNNVLYKVTLIEATNKTGGRSLTLRSGDKFTEVMPNGESVTQKCDFTNERGQPYKPYLNAGPGRIPSGHRNVIALCEELDVQLETYIMQTRSNLVYSGPLPDCKRTPTISPAIPGAEEISYLLTNRRVANDTRGHLAAYLWKCTKQLTDLSNDQKTAFKSLLRSFGMLQADGTYIGSDRSGFKIPPGVKDRGVFLPPMTMTELLDSAFWSLSFYQPEDYLWQTSSFQPVGGMDKIEEALTKAIKKLGGKILLNSPMTSVKRQNGKFLVEYEGGGKPKEWDICISNIPIPLLQGKLDLDGFDETYKKSLEMVFNTPDFLRPTCKVGWQAERILWQDPADPYEVGILGGISYTSDEMTQMWYPSDNFFAKYGILTGAYNYGECAEAWGKLLPSERLIRARRQAANLHGERFAAELDKGLSIAWQNIPTQKGGWVDWENVTENDLKPLLGYNRLIEGDNGFYVTGDQISHLPGWKEGAVLSAFNVYAQVIGATNYNVETYKLNQFPDTRALTQGHYF